MTNFQEKQSGHTLIISPCRQEKERMLVCSSVDAPVAIPSLTQWKGTLISIGLGNEVFQSTSGNRQAMEDAVYHLNFTSTEGHSHCFNPIEEIGNSPTEQARNALDIGYAFLPDTKDYWQNGARCLLTGLILFFNGQNTLPCTFGEILRLLRSHDTTYNIAVILDTHPDIHPYAYMALASFLQRADSERSATISTLDSAICQWADPLTDTITSKEHFSLNTLANQQYSVYLSVPCNYTLHHRALSELIINKLFNVIQNPLHNNAPRLLVVDGALIVDNSTLANALRNIARLHNVTLFIHCESMLQIPESLQSVFQTIVAHTPQDYYTAKAIAELTWTAEESAPKPFCNVQGVLALPLTKQMILSVGRPTEIIDKVELYNEEDLLPPADIPLQELVIADKISSYKNPEFESKKEASEPKDTASTDESNGENKDNNQFLAPPNKKPPLLPAPKSSTKKCYSDLRYC